MKFKETLVINGANYVIYEFESEKERSFFFNFSSNRSKLSKETQENLLKAHPFTIQDVGQDNAIGLTAGCQKTNHFFAPVSPLYSILAYLYREGICTKDYSEEISEKLFPTASDECASSSSLS